MDASNKRLEDIPFSLLYSMQLENQNTLIRKGMYEGFKSDMTVFAPVDDTKLMSYHVQQLVSEIGEVLASDKRWKNFRNGHYNRNEKLDEIADVFIVAMNVAIFSGFGSQDVTNAILKKLETVKQRIENLKK